ncbi:MAG: hypothetical protein FJ137_14965 [Deltaproteobacteria bacterium]|nr:hypothetical protein [Deltaproteobacteria bacterium]
MLLRALLVVIVALPLLSTCEPVTLPHELPGPPGCGRRDPNQSGPSTLSVAQNTTVRNMGMPGALEDNERGGKTWLYSRQAGSVFGESATIEAFVFDAQGLLVAQKTEVRKQVGK